MTMLMNEYDVRDAVVRWDRPETPNLLMLATTLDNLRRWTNENSDGWAYWSKPSNAAKSLQEVLQVAERDYRRGFPLDALNGGAGAERVRVLRPIKAFLTRRGVAHSEVLG